MLMTAINKNTCFYVKEELTHSNHKICWKKRTYFSYYGNLIIFYCGAVEHPIFTAVLRTFNLSKIHNLNFMAFDETANLSFSLPSFLLALLHTSWFLQIFHTPPHTTQNYRLFACSWSKEHIHDIRNNKGKPKYATTPCHRT